MARWRLSGNTDQGLRLEQVPLTRGFGQDQFTWANLLYFRLAEVRVYVLYFPSRFDLPVDATSKALLRTFADNTPTRTSVNFWDPRDEHFADALSLFGVSAPPALVLASGLGSSRDDLPDESNLYCVSFTDMDVLGDPGHFVAAVNLAHEVLTKGDPKEIARLIRSRNREGLLAVAAAVSDQVVKLKPKLGLPGGLSIALGGS
jgi:hypothetical protein